MAGRSRENAWATSPVGGVSKPWVAVGYGLAAFSKPLFPLAASAPALMAARFIDRIGKGIRGSPRDAMVADETPAEIRGRAFGLRQSLDTVGALLAPLAAIGLMAWFANDIRIRPIRTVEPLARGHFLVAGGEDIAEIDADGQVVWHVKIYAGLDERGERGLYKAARVGKR